jgi:amidophosphoribosyltransferase
VFTGCYVTGDITEDYLDNIAEQRNDAAKKKREKDSSNLEMHNER